MSVIGGWPAIRSTWSVTTSSSPAAIAAGELDVVTDHVERIAGHPPMTLTELLQRHPESWEHLRS